MNLPKSILFIPVSSPEGIGEYMRSLIIANEINKQRPDINIHFVLSEQAPYTATCPYETHVTPTSPTKHVKLVNQYIETITPSVTIFDASGRKSQLAAAQRCGSKVIFISQHKKKRSRGLKWGRLKLTDNHWVVQPSFVMDEISTFEQLKLSLLKKPAPVNIGPVFTPVDTTRQTELLNRYNVEKDEFILFNAGSGGHKVGNELAADIYAQAAEDIASKTGVKCIMVYGSNYPRDINQNQQHIAVKELNNQQFIALLDAAKLVVISGGDSLLQTIAMTKPCVTTPVSKDQPPRISACAQQQLVQHCATNSAEMIDKIQQSLDDDTLNSLKKRLNNAGCSNGLVVALQDIENLLNENKNA